MKKRVSAALLSMVLAVGITFFPAKALNPTETYGDFQYRNDGDHITILGYTSTEPDIVFPDYIDGLPVTVIAEVTFTPKHPETQSIYLSRTIASYYFNNLSTPSLANIYVAKDNPHYSSINGILFSKDKKTIVQYPPARTGNYRIPNGTEIIGEKSFYCSNANEVYIPDSVIQIEKLAFFLGQIEKVRFSESLVNIDDKAFMNCNYLKYAELPKSLQFAKDSAFAYCNRLEWVHIPGDTKLSAFAFFNCSNLREVIMTGSVTIGYLSFGNVPAACNIYHSINTTELDIGPQYFTLSAKENNQAMAGVAWADKDVLPTFSAPRIVESHMATARQALIKNGIDDQLLSNICSISFEKKPATNEFSLLFRVSPKPAEQPSIYQMDESGKITEANVYWAGNWAIVSEGQEGVYIITQKGAAMGDLDGDGSINIVDVMELCKMIARRSVHQDIEDSQILRSDLDGDHTISIADVMEVCKMIARHTDL